MADWYLGLFPAVCALLALLETDNVLLGNLMLSRPIIVGPLTGLICGEFVMGAAIGVLTELFTLGSLPVGSVLALNGTVAAGAGVLLMAGPFAVPAAAAFPVGLFLGWGHSRLEFRVRGWRAGLAAEAAGFLERREKIPWSSLLLKSVMLHAAVTVLVLGAVGVLAPALAWLWPWTPRFAQAGLDTAFRWAPYAGLGVLLQILWRKR